MSQVSLLSVDVGQGSDTHSAKGNASNKSPANASAFSNAMEQHYPTKTVKESPGKEQQDGNVVSKAATVPHQVNTIGDDLKQAKPTKADDAHILPVPLPIDDAPLSAEQVGNDAPVVSMFLPVDGESIIAKLNVNDDAHILPVPLPIDDESLTSNLTVSENTATLLATDSSDNKQHLYITNPKDKEFSPPIAAPVPLSPLEVEIRAIEKAGGTFNGDPKEPGKQQTSTISFQTQTQTPQVSNGNAGDVVNDDAVDLLKMLNGAQQLLTKQSAENTAINQDTKLVSEQVMASNKTVTQGEPAKNLTTEQVMAGKDSKIDQVISTLTTSDKAKISALESGKEVTLLSENTPKNVVRTQTKNVVDIATANEDMKATASVANTDKPTVNNADLRTAEILAKNTIDNVTDSNVADSKATQETKAIVTAQNGAILAANEQDTIDEPIDIKQAADSKKSQETVENNINFASKISNENAVNKVNESDLAVVKGAHSAQLNAEIKVISGENKDAKVSSIEPKPLNVGEFKRANENEQAQTRTVNQSTASVIAAPTIEPKAEVNQKTAMSDDVSKLASGAVDAEQLGKKEAEKQALQPDKNASAFNQTLAAQAASPMVSSGELAAKQEQSFESAINTLTSNAVQTQKSITAINTETIAIYRKDFADAVKDKVMVMINQKIQQVEIQLDPPEMGNIHVRVNLQSEQAAVQFVVQNQQAKDALEQNMGKLRDMLAESGVDVGDASIEQRQAKEQNGNGFDGQANNGESGDSGEGASNENDNSMLNVVKASSTGVDYYA